MIIGILRETKIPPDNRVPLSPKQCRLVEEEFSGIRVFVEPSKVRCFADQEYIDEGITVTSDLADCDVLLGVKEVDPARLINGKTYICFSHTIKKQSRNKVLLKTVLEKRVRLVDYEPLTDSNGVRIIGFGRWAGIVGSYFGIRAMCIRQNTGILPHPQECRELKELMSKTASVSLPSLRIAITGDGRVAHGSVEMMKAFGIREAGVEEYLKDTEYNVPVYVLLDPEKYNRHKSGKAFELHHFFNHPEEYESNFGRFCNKTDLLVMSAYWDPKAPVLFTPDQMKDKSFRIKAIADITCDMNGAIPSTLRTTNFLEPYYDYNPVTSKEETPFSNPENITVLSIDNLPNGLPVEASIDFGQSIIKNVLPLLLYGDRESIIARATVAEGGKITSKFNYLADWVDQPD
jgi:saccharopine dehydrogenase (NAD+, L-lysine forming)